MRLTLLTAASAAALIGPGLALAADAADADAGGARWKNSWSPPSGRQTNLQDTPIAISAFSAQTLADLNYADHIAESGQETPPHQVWLSKASTATNGPFDPIQIPKVSAYADYEAEMVAMIGTGGRHITKEDAAKAVFGYCVGNDATERAPHAATGGGQVLRQPRPVRSLDHYSPMRSPIPTRCPSAAR